ncbi:unnamed protein product [Leptosia nina]|uniref:Uncharacterized protein n=1 Tax=Leptosia nina TaxID=320188 RepID=A0AAV1JVI6_9NEOP
MDEKVLIIFLVFGAANCHDYYGDRQGGSLFSALPHMLNDMFNAHRNILLGNNYNRQPSAQLPIQNRYGNGQNSGYQNRNGYQNQAQGGQNFDDSNQSQDSLESRLQGNFAGKPEVVGNIAPSPPTTINAQMSSLHLNTVAPYVVNSTSLPDTEKIQNSDDKNMHSLTNNTHTSPVKQNKPFISVSKQNSGPEVAETNVNKDPLLAKENEPVKVNQPRDPNEIVFPDHEDEVKRQAQRHHKNNKSQFPNKFNDTPQILYAVNIAPDTIQWNNKPNAPLTNSVNAPNPPQTSPTSYATLQIPNQISLTNKMAEADPFGNNIVLPNPSGGSTLYSIVNLPNTIANANIPSQMYQTSSVIANPSNYQQQTSIPTANSGIINGMPYYVVSLPSQPKQNLQTVPYTNAPVTYTVGYVSSNGQTVLVPSPTVVYQIVPVTSQNVPGSLVPATNVQGSASQPVLSGQRSQSYVPVSTGQSTTGDQVHYVPVSTVQDTSNSPTNYVPLSNGNTNPVQYVPVSTGQGSTVNSQNYVPLTSDQGNVQTLAAPSDTVYLPPDTQSVTLLSFKDKAEEKQKKKKKKP